MKEVSRSTEARVCLCVCVCVWFAEGTGADRENISLARNKVPIGNKIV